jgi:hypothetical protein
MRGPHVRELVMLLVRHQAIELGLALAKPFDRGDFRLELPRDESRAPAEHALRDVDVGEKVIAHIEDVLPRSAEKLFH